MGWLTSGDVPPTALARYALGELLKVRERNPDCPCFLNVGLWPGTEIVNIRDEETHRGGGKSCGERREERWGSVGVKSPSKIRDPKALPHTRVVVIDR